MLGLGHGIGLGVDDDVNELLVLLACLVAEDAVECICRLMNIEEKCV